MVIIIVAATVAITATEYNGGCKVIRRAQVMSKPVIMTWVIMVKLRFSVDCMSLGLNN